MRGYHPVLYQTMNARQLCQPILRANVEISTNSRRFEPDSDREKEDDFLFLSKSEKTESNRCKKKEKAFIEIFRKEKLRKERKLAIRSVAKQLAHSEYENKKMERKKEQKQQKQQQQESKEEQEEPVTEKEIPIHNERLNE